MDSYYTIKRNYTTKEWQDEVKNMDAIANTDTEWYAKYNIISHSMGSIDGKNYTNSLEALENSYGHGNRLFDADVNIASDGALVLRHEWTDALGTEYSERIPNHDEFNSTLIYGKYHPLDFDSLLDRMTEKIDMYVITDIKGDVQEICSKMIDRIKQRDNSADLFERIIVSLYSQEDYDKTLNFNDSELKKYSIRQYVNNNNNNRMVVFCLRNNIPVVNYQKDYFFKDDISLFNEKHIKLFIAVVDDLSEFDKIRKKNNYTGIVSNSIYEEDIL